MDDKNLQNKHSTLLKRQKLLLNEKLIFTHYYNRVKEEELHRDRDEFDKYFNNIMAHEREIGALDINQKYYVAHSELQNAYTKWETFDKKKMKELMNY